MSMEDEIMARSSKNGAEGSGAPDPPSPDPAAAAAPEVEIIDLTMSSDDEGEKSGAPKRPVSSERVIKPKEKKDEPAAVAKQAAPMDEAAAAVPGNAELESIIARLVGDGIDYKIKRGNFSVMLGRQNNKLPVDVVLPSAGKGVSRNHARVYYDYEGDVRSRKNRRFYLEVLGKNGVKVNGVQYDMGAEMSLKSGALLQLESDVSFHFYIGSDLPETTPAAKEEAKKEKKVKEGAAAATSMKLAAAPSAERNKDQSAAAAAAQPKKEDESFVSFMAALNNVVGGSKQGIAASAAGPAPVLEQLERKEADDAEAGGSDEQQDKEAASEGGVEAVFRKAAGGPEACTTSKGAEPTPKSADAVAENVPAPPKLATAPGEEREGPWPVLMSVAEVTRPRGNATAPAPAPTSVEQRQNSTTIEGAETVDATKPWSEKEGPGQHAGAVAMLAEPAAPMVGPVASPTPAISDAVAAAPMEIYDAAPPLPPPAAQLPAPFGWSRSALAEFNSNAPHELVPYTAAVLALHGLLAGGRVGPRRAWEAVTAPLLRQRWPEEHTAGLEGLANAIVSAVAVHSTPRQHLQETTKWPPLPARHRRHSERATSPNMRCVQQGEHASRGFTTPNNGDSAGAGAGERESTHLIPSIDILATAAAVVSAAEGVSGAGVVVGPKGRRSQRARPPAGYHAHLESGGIIEEGYGRSRKRARSPGGRFISKRQRGGGSSDEEMEGHGYRNRGGDGGGQAKRRGRHSGSAAAAATDRPLSWHPAAPTAPPAPVQTHNAGELALLRSYRAVLMHDAQILLHIVDKIGDAAELGICAVIVRNQLRCALEKLHKAGTHLTDKEWDLFNSIRSDLRDSAQILLPAVDAPAVVATLYLCAGTFRGHLQRVIEDLDRLAGMGAATPPAFLPPAQPQFPLAPPPQPPSQSFPAPALPVNLALPPQQMYAPSVPQHVEHVHPLACPVPPQQHLEPVGPCFPPAALPPPALHLGNAPHFLPMLQNSGLAQAALAAVQPSPPLQRSGPTPAPAPKQSAHPLLTALAAHPDKIVRDPLAAALAAVASGVDEDAAVARLADQIISIIQARPLPVPLELRDASGGLCAAKVQASLKNTLRGMISEAGAPSAMATLAPATLGPENSGANKSLKSQIQGLMAAAQPAFGDRSGGGGSEPLVAFDQNPANTKLQETLARLEEHVKCYKAGQALAQVNVAAAMTAATATAAVATAAADPVAYAPTHRSLAEIASLPGSTGQQEVAVVTADDVAAAAAPAPAAAQDGMPPAPKPPGPPNSEGSTPPLTQSMGVAALQPLQQAPVPPPVQPPVREPVAQEPAVQDSAQACHRNLQSIISEIDLVEMLIQQTHDEGAKKRMDTWLNGLIQQRNNHPDWLARQD